MSMQSTSEPMQLDAIEMLLVGGGVNLAQEIADMEAHSRIIAAFP